MDETQSAYLAGLVDADGSIRLKFYKHKKNGKKYPRLEIKVSNTDFKVMGWLKKVTGVGYVWTDKRQPPRKEYHQWFALTAAARKILNEILPYLVIKRTKAEQILAEDARLVAPRV